MNRDRRLAEAGNTTDHSGSSSVRGHSQPGGHSNCMLLSQRLVETERPRLFVKVATACPGPKGRDPWVGT